MKLWHYLLLAAVLVVVPVLSACGPSESEIAYQEAYRKALIEYQKDMDEYQKQNEAYREQLAKGLEEYLKAYQDYQRNLQEQQLQELQKQQ